MHSFDHFSSPLNRYRQRGDVRPSLGMLTGVVAEIGDTSAPEMQVSLADIHIDMAMQSQANRAAHLSRAQSLLKGVVKAADKYARNGHGDPLYLASGAKARLRMAELPSWKRVSQGDGMHIDYFNYLEAASHVTDFVSDSQRAESTLTEFVPLLLGARAIHQGDKGGLRGRLSLSREDRRPYLPADGNPNWDFGIVTGRDADAFDNPTTRVQVKTCSDLDLSAYTRAGIHVISAEEQGFADPVSIVYDCLDEYAAEAPFHVREQSARLNEISHNIGGCLGLELSQAS
jgi:hypothetical protein